MARSFARAGGAGNGAAVVVVVGVARRTEIGGASRKAFPAALSAKSATRNRMPKVSAEASMPNFDFVGSKTRLLISLSGSPASTAALRTRASIAESALAITSVDFSKGSPAAPSTAITPLFKVSDRLAKIGARPPSGPTRSIKYGVSPK